MKKLRCITVKRPFGKHLPSKDIVLGSLLGVGAQLNRALGSPQIIMIILISVIRKIYLNAIREA